MINFFLASFKLDGSVIVNDKNSKNAFNLENV
jgi:hypothetical protein